MEAGGVCGEGECGAGEADLIRTFKIIIITIRFAIIGCGRIAQRHAEHISTRGQLVAVCDIVAEKAQALADQYKANAYTNLEEMLTAEKELDVIAVCTPNKLHAIHSIQSLQAGIHVLCEKPMAISVQDGKEMLKAATTAGKHLFVVKQNRFNPPVQAVKKLIDEGRLGKIYSVQLTCLWNRDEAYYKDSWKGTLDMDGGTLYTQFSHFIDLLYWMIGDIQEVQSYMANHAHQGMIQFEDTGVVIVKFVNGVIGTIHYSVNSYKKNMEGSLLIVGEKGTVKIGGEYLNELEYQNIEGYRIEHLPAGNRANDYGEYKGSMSNHGRVYDNVVEVLNKGGIAEVGGEEGLKTVQMVEKIYQSRKTV